MAKLWQEEETARGQSPDARVTMRQATSAAVVTELLALRQDTNHERHNELVEWWGDAHYDRGDVDATNLGKNVEALAAK